MASPSPRRLAAVLLVLTGLGLWWWRVPAPPAPGEAGISRAERVVGAEERAPAAAAAGGDSAGESRVETPGGLRPARMIVQKRTQLPAGPLQDYLAGQRIAADAGDADAAYRLGLALRECAQIAADAGALEARIQRMYQTRQWQGLAVEAPDLMAAELRRRYRRCEGVPAAARANYYDWMVRAADAGSVEALESMSFQLPPGKICRERELESCDATQQAHTFALRERQAAWLRRARALGSANALWQLGGAYLNGEMLAPDSIEALANLRAYQLVMQSFGLDDPVAGLVTQLRASLRPVEVTQAEARATALIGNPRCCVYIR